MPVLAADVQKSYIAYFGRPADPVGLAYWQGQTASAMNAGFAASAEFATLYNGLSTVSQVNQVYLNVLGRQSDVPGLLYWAGQITAGTQTIGTLVTSMMTNALGVDITTIANRVTYATSFTAALTTADQIIGYSGTAAATAARTAMTPVLDTAASLTTATAALTTSIATVVGAGAPVGTIYTLTTGLDTFPGTSGNDTFNAAEPAQFQVADTLVGGSGTDTLNYTNSAAAVGLPAASLTGIEVINARAVTNGITSGDLSVYSGVTTFNSDRSNAAITVTNLAKGGTFGIIGNASVTNATTTAFGYATAADAAVINVSGGTLGTDAVTLTGTGLLSTTFNSTGAANVLGNFADSATSKTLTINATTGLTLGTIDDGGTAVRTTITINATGDVTTGAITSANTTSTNTVAITGTGKVTTNLNGVASPTITVSGSGAVSLGTLNAAATTVTSTQTGGSLTLTTSTTATAKITGGAGNDVISIGAVTLTTGFVEGGSGTDTLDIGANVTSANTVNLAAKFTNFETLRVAGTYDISLLPSITALQLSTATNVITNMTATQAAAVQVRGDQTSTSLALATATGTADILTMTFGVGTTTVVATNGATALTTTGFETLNIINNPGPTVAGSVGMLTTIDTLVDSSLRSVVMTGSAVALTDASVTRVGGTTYDASALTGNSNATIGLAAASIKGLTLGGNLASGSVVTGSNFIDTITLATITAAGSTYNLGSGADAISSTFAALHTGAVYNTVDGGSGTDTLTITNGAGASLTFVDADFKGLTNIEKITVTNVTTGTTSITTGGFYDSNFKGAAATLTVTSTAGNTTIDESTSSGVTTIAVTTTTGAITISGGAGNQTITTNSAAVTGNVSITTLGGNDLITVATLTSVSAGPIVLSAGAGNDTIVSAGAAATITGGTGADTMTGSAGVVDTYSYANTGDTGTPTSSNFDTITNWVTTSDVIDFAGSLALPGNAVTSSSGVAALATTGIATFNAADTTLALHIAAVEAALTKSTAASNAGTTPTALQTAIWTEGADTFLFVTDGTAGVGSGDTLIKLTGVVNTGTFTLGGNNVTAIS